MADENNEQHVDDEKEKLKSFFWQQSKFEPKRDFRWRLLFDDIIYHIPEQYVVKVDKPSISFETRSIVGLGVKEKVSDIGETRPIEIDLIDDEYNTVVNFIYHYYKVCGFEFSKNLYTDNYGSQLKINTEKAKKKTRNIQIQVLSSEGIPIEVWELYGAYISEFRQSSLSYEKNDLSIYTIKIEYDMFEYRINSKDKGFGGDMSSYSERDTEPPRAIQQKLTDIHGGPPGSRINRRVSGRIPENEKSKK